MKFKTYLLPALLVLACLVNWGMTTGAMPAPAKAKWEYQHRVLQGKITDTTTPEMNLFGVNGWELVAVYDDHGRTVMIYKRPL